MAPPKRRPRRPRRRSPARRGEHPGACRTGTAPGKQGSTVNRVELARYLVGAICQDPEEAKVEHLWTPTADLVFLRVRGAARKRLKQEDLAVVIRILERLGGGGEREFVVDLR